MGGRRSAKCFGILAGALSLIGVGLGTASIVYPRWYEIKTDAGTQRFGLFQLCDEANVCKPLVFPDFVSADCSADKDEMSRRMMGVKGTTIAATGLAALAMMFQLIGSSLCVYVLGFLLSSLSLLAFVAPVGLFVFTYHQWYYCGTPYCNGPFEVAGGTGTCKSFFSTSYFLVAAAAFAMLASTILLIFAMCCFGSRRKVQRESSLAATPRGEMPVYPSQRRESTLSATPSKMGVQSMNSSTVGVKAQPPAAQKDAKEPASRSASQKNLTSQKNLPTPPKTVNLAEWEHDAACGYYWSDREKLFYDAETGHFYDPVSELWYDPEVSKWYRGVD